MKLIGRIILALFVSSLLTLTLLNSITASSATANWPQWRGPDGQGVSAETGLPVEWSQTKNVKWKTAIAGRGHSSPIVWGKKIFLTTALDGEAIPGRKPGVTHKLQDGTEFVHPDAVGADLKHAFKVICLDRQSGKILWERVAYEGAVYDSRHKKASFASSTPATDGKYVFAFFGAEGLYAYDKKTGKEPWRVPRKVDITWSTPVLVNTATRTELVTSAAEAIIAYDPLTGKELWRHKGLESNAVPTPVVSHD